MSDFARLLVALCGLALLMACGPSTNPGDIADDSALTDVSDDAVEPADTIVECPDDCWEPGCGFTTTCGMAPVPAGPFWMGCDESSIDDCVACELPYHQVTLSAYYIDRTEVTVGAWRACVSAGACTAPAEPAENCAWLLPDHEQHPMTCVDWFQAQGFCEWLGKRLPTEAEWEKAARGTDGRTYPWGEDALSCDFAVTFDEILGGRGCGTDDTMPVCSRPAGDSPYGLCDMAGNVWERVADWYGGAYYTENQFVDPPGPSTGEGRVSRGGTITLQSNTVNLRTFHRNYHQPSTTDQLLGFRCAVSAE